MSNQQQAPSMTLEKATGMISRYMNQITTLVIGLEDNINARDVTIAERDREIATLKLVIAAADAKVPE